MRFMEKGANLVKIGDFLVINQGTVITVKIIYVILLSKKTKNCFSVDTLNKN